MTLIRNIAAMLLSQIGGYAIPLLTIPYLSRTLGVEGFGTIGLTMTIASFASMLADWGFSLSATQLVAQNSTDHEALREVFWDTILAKLALAALACAASAAVITMTPSLHRIVPLLPFVFINIFAASLNVFWFLQGLERLGRIAIIGAALQAAGVPLLFWLVKNGADVSMALAVQSIPVVGAAAASILIAANAIRLTPVRFSLQGAKRQLHDGASLFASNTAISLYTQSQVPMLGFAASPTEVGFYHGADRVRRAVQGLIGPVSAAVYPRLNNLVITDPPAAARLMVVLLWAQGGATLLVGVALFFAAPLIVTGFLGDAYAPAIPILRCLSALPFVIGVSNALGYNMMIPLGERSVCTKIVSASAILGTALLVPACIWHGAIGAAVATALTEIFTTMTMLIWYVLRGRSLLRAMASTDAPSRP
jgi:O-antigen/teichoic acid export membrane protein